MKRSLATCASIEISQQTFKVRNIGQTLYQPRLLIQNPTDQRIQQYQSFERLYFVWFHVMSIRFAKINLKDGLTNEDADAFAQDMFMLHGLTILICRHFLLPHLNMAKVLTMPPTTKRFNVDTLQIVSITEPDMFRDRLREMVKLMFCELRPHDPNFNYFQYDKATFQPVILRKMATLWTSYRYCQARGDPPVFQLYRHLVDSNGTSLAEETVYDPSIYQMQPKHAYQLHHVVCETTKIDSPYNFKQIPIIQKEYAFFNGKNQEIDPRTGEPFARRLQMDDNIIIIHDSDSETEEL